MSDHPKRRASDNRVRKPRKPRAKPVTIEPEVKSVALSKAGTELDAYLGMLERAMRDPTVDVIKLTSLYDLHERMLQQRAKIEADEAFVAMQAELPRIKKTGVLEYPVDRNNPRGPKYKVANYAKWEDIDEGVKPVYSKHGFGLNHRIEPRGGDGGGLLVTAVLLHRNGNQREATIPIPLETQGGMNNQQRYGSALSYGKRYSACAVLNIVTEGEDDDAVKADETFISEAEVEELHALCQETGRREVDILRRMFGDTVLSFSELPPGTSFIAVKNTLLGIKQLQQERRQQGGAE